MTEEEKKAFVRNGFDQIKGPCYADRVRGELTFRDWDSWEDADKAKWREEYEMHRTCQMMWADMDAGTFSLSDIT